ncbi:unnamed protein product [Ilex paraguariensis]|uniref:Uncharacterized protein n=1 Tax=Ilex paraguariensis TaxID=185542 RepID=A0ABC8UL75_9AQUA
MSDMEQWKQRNRGRESHWLQDKNGNPPGILQNEIVDPIPDLFKTMIKMLVTWNVLPPTSVPDSCTINIHNKGDYIPPHIEHQDFVRPFLYCVVS